MSRYSAQVGVGVIAGGKLIKTSSANKLETTNSGGRCYYYTSTPASGKSATNRLLTNGKLIDV